MNSRDDVRKVVRYLEKNSAKEALAELFSDCLGTTEDINTYAIPFLSRIYSSDMDRGAQKTIITDLTYTLYNEPGVISSLASNCGPDTNTDPLGMFIIKLVDGASNNIDKNLLELKNDKVLLIEHG